MAGFVKLDCGIADSSLWVERDTRSIFLTALVMAEPHELRVPEAQIEVRSLKYTGWVVPAGWYGIVPAAGSGIVRRDGCDMEVGYAALEALGSPDLESRSQEFEGRRLVRINGGYLVLNYFKYRDRDYTAAERMRRLRARRKASVTANVTQAEDREQSAENIEREDVPPKMPGRNGGQASLLLKRIRDMAETATTPGQGVRTFIRRDVVAGLGPEVLLAYEAVGGAERLLAATGKDLSFLTREFADALSAAKENA